MLRELAGSLIDLVYPPVCALCERTLPRGSGFCDECREEIVSDPYPTCSRCGSTTGAFSDTVDGCPRCRGERFAFDRVVRVGPYEGLRRELILRCKRDERVAGLAGTLFADSIVAKLKVEPLDLVLPVPLFWRRRWSRGYNQSEVFARALAGQIGKPVALRLLRRIRSTPPQTRLSLAARRENVRGAFQTRGACGGRFVLVDDVLTTGATAGEAAAALKRAGANRVVVAVLAHG